jgi:D-alanyl-D-alanine carboxypeptidase
MRKNLIQASCLMFLLSVISAAQTAHTETAAARRLTEWLAAYNGTSWDSYREFLRENFVSPPVGGFQDIALRDLTGGFDLKKIEEETPTKATALVAERNSDGFARLTVEVEAVEPYRILKLEAPRVERPAEFAPPHLNDDQLIAALRKKLQERTASDRFAGAVIVAKDGKTVFAQAYGLADRERHIPNTLNTRFSIASMNKMITAVAIMQLVQAGKLGLDDRLGKYLTDYPNKELAEKATIGELLTNTGGTGDIWGPAFDEHRMELNALQDYVNLYGSRVLRFEPGSRWEYSNYGFILLGLVIEKVSGKSYYDYVREQIYEPAGMASTGSGPEDQTIRGRSVPYTNMGTRTWHPVTETPIKGTSAGGGYSTVGDVLKFANALQGNKLLNADYTKLLTTGEVSTPFGFDAYGFGVQIFNGNQCFGHNGAGPGVNGDLEICRDANFTVVALTNIDPPAAEQVTQFVLDRLPASKR